MIQRSAYHRFSAPKHRSTGILIQLLSAKQVVGHFLIVAIDIVPVV
jgi:hypothetical protein